MCWPSAPASPSPKTARPALLKGFKDLKRMTALMRQPRTAADEPAGTYYHPHRDAERLT